MKKILFVLSFVTIFNMSFSQVTEKEEDLKTQNKDTTDGWKKGGIISINFAQSAHSEFWAAGGENSYALNSVASIFAKYKKAKHSWENTLDLGYGMLKQGESDIMKTDDKIDFASKYGRKAGKNTYYAVLLNYKTQFADGFDYAADSTNAISKFMAPGYLITAIGIDYKPNNNFSAFVAPLTSKLTFVLDDDLANASAFGVDSAKNMRSEIGGYIKVVYNKEIMKNVNLLTKIDLFSNYIENPQNIDISWEVLINMKINKYLTASISTQMIYDHDIRFAIDEDKDGIPEKEGPRLQFKEVLAIGLSLKF